MDGVIIQLAFLWTATMLVYLLGDVLRIFSGDTESSEELQKMRQMGQVAWVSVSLLMVIPILMIVLTLFLPQEINRWANIITSGFFFLSNLVGLPTYKGHYDRVLLVVSMVFNVIVIWLAWGWA